MTRSDRYELNNFDLRASKRREGGFLKRAAAHVTSALRTAVRGHALVEYDFFAEDEALCGSEGEPEGVLRLTGGLYRIGDRIPAGRYDLLHVCGRGCVRKFYDDTLQNHNYSHYVSASFGVPRGVDCRVGEYLRIDRGVTLELRLALK